MILFLNRVFAFLIGILHVCGDDPLPETLPQVEIEKRLQTKGYATIYQYKNNLYVTTGNLNGQELSPYNEPTHVNINIPAFNLSQRLEIGKQ